MPNYKVFQDTADSMRVKIFGVDDSGATTPLLTDASGRMEVAGNFDISGQVSGTVTVSGQVSGIVDIGSGSVKITSGVEVSGNVAVSGTVSVSGAVDIGSGSVKVTSGVEVSGNVAVSGTVSVSGAVDIGSGSVKITSGVEVSGIANTSGTALYVRGAIIDSGPVSSGISGSGSGAFTSSIYDVLGLRNWTLAVKYSGDNQADVTAQLQMSATGSGEDFINIDSASNFSGQNWQFFVTTYQVRYARIYYTNSSGVSGAMSVTFQAEY
ncbi:MAG: DUF6385 domain-containing protein [Chitinophagales bacterium]